MGSSKEIPQIFSTMLKCGLIDTEKLTIEMNILSRHASYINIHENKKNGVAVD